MPGSTQSARIAAVFATIAVFASLFSVWFFRVDTEVTEATSPTSRPLTDRPAPAKKVAAKRVHRPSSPEAPQPEPEIEIVEPDPDLIFDGHKLEDLALVAMARAHRTRDCYLQYASEYGDLSPMPTVVLRSEEGGARLQLGEAISGQESIESCLNEAFSDVRFESMEEGGTPMTWRLPEV